MATLHTAQCSRLNPKLFFWIQLLLIKSPGIVLKSYLEVEKNMCSVLLQFFISISTAHWNGIIFLFRHVRHFNKIPWNPRFLRCGGIQQLRGQNFAIFWPPTPCVDSFYTLSVNKNRHFLTPSPPHLVLVVIEWPLVDLGGWIPEMPVC